MIRFDVDYGDHIKLATMLATTGHSDRPIPHFLFHVLLIGISQFIPGDSLQTRFETGAWIISLLCYMSIGLIIFSWLYPLLPALSRRTRGLIPISLTLLLILANPITMPTWGNHNLYLGYLVANTYHNPTVLLLKPFALLTFLFILRALDGEQVGWKALAVCVILAVLGTTAKPNYALALVPALGLMGLYIYWKKRPINWRLFATIFLSLAGMLLYQYISYKSSNGGGFELAPLKISDLYSPDGLAFLRFILSIAFPLAVYLLYFPLTRKRLDLNLAWLAFGVAAAYFYLLAETVRWQDANFIWGTQVTVFILFVVSFGFLLQQYKTVSQSRLKWYSCLVLFALHVIGGIAFYIIHMTPVWPAWW